jgi:hypothetical protein
MKFLTIFLIFIIIFNSNQTIRYLLKVKGIKEVSEITRKFEDHKVIEKEYNNYEVEIFVDNNNIIDESKYNILEKEFSKPYEEIQKVSFLII